MNSRELMITAYKKESATFFEHVPNEFISSLFDIVLNTYEIKGTIYLMGNGGTAGILMNTVTDWNIHPFTNEDKTKLTKEIPRLKVINLSSDACTITGVGNDSGFSEIYTEQLKCFELTRMDTIIVVSGSGTSPNIRSAINYASSLVSNPCIVLMTRNPNAPKEKIDLFLEIEQSTSIFPGQTGKNNNNFHFEDAICKISHIISGLLKQHVKEKYLS